MSKEKPTLNLGDLFDTPDKKAQAAAALEEMTKTAGWSIMQQLIGENLQHHRDLLEQGAFDDLRQVDDQQNIIGLLKWLLVIPKDIIASCAPDPQAQSSIAADPYDKLIIPAAEQENPQENIPTNP